LNELWLHNNNIEDITPLIKFKTGKIEVLSLFGNKIDKDKFANTIQQMQETIKNFQFKEVIF
jgi:Leucine-rich repeat (LRR) protein